jgi:hypothetical protein
MEMKKLGWKFVANEKQKKIVNACFLFLQGPF